MSKYTLKPHLAELNTLRGLINQITDWLGKYKKLEEQEEILYNLYCTCQKDMKSYYKQKYKRVRSRLDQLGKRLEFTSLISLYKTIMNRMEFLRKFDSELTREDIMVSKRNG